MFEGEYDACKRYVSASANKWAGRGEVEKNRKKRAGNRVRMKRDRKDE